METQSTPSVAAARVLRFFLPFALASGLFLGLDWMRFANRTPDQLGPPTDSPIWKTKIAFIRDGALFVVRLDGSGLRQLTGDEVPSRKLVPHHVAWSPDGNWLAVTGSGTYGEEPRLILMSPDGTNRIKLTDGAFSEPAWSPDGNEIALLKLRDHMNPGGDIYVVNLKGEMRRLPIGPKRLSDPTWSPDGRRIAFTFPTRSHHDSAPFRRWFGGSGIGVVGHDGSSFRRLSPDWLLEPADPAWSPDGRLVAFSALRQWKTAGGRMGAREIFVMKADGSNPMRLTRSKEADEHTPIWSPDGSMIAFLKTPPFRPGDCGTCTRVALWVMNSDGSHPRRIVESPVSPYGFQPSVHSPSWQPLPNKAKTLALPSPSPVPSPKGAALSACEPVKESRLVDGRPSQFVGVKLDGRLVVARSDTGQVERALAKFAPYPSVANGYQRKDPYVTEISLSPDGSSVFFSTSFLSHTYEDGELKVDTGPNEDWGYIWRVCLAGGEVEKVTLGWSFDLSSDGNKLAFLRGNDLIVFDLRDGAERRWGGSGHPFLSGAVWAPDSKNLVLGATCHECAGWVLLFDPASPVAPLDSKLLGPPKSKPSGTGWGAVGFRAYDGLLAVHQYCCSLDAGSYFGGSYLLVVNPKTGLARGSHELPRNVGPSGYDSTGRHQFFQGWDERDGRVLYWRSGGALNRLSEGDYVDVDW